MRFEQTFAQCKSFFEGTILRESTYLACVRRGKLDSRCSVFLKNTVNCSLHLAQHD